MRSSSAPSVGTFLAYYAVGAKRLPELREIRDFNRRVPENYVCIDDRRLALLGLSTQHPY